MNFMDKFDSMYAAKLENRMPTFRSVLREAMILNATRVFETGCIRQEDNWAGDGQSTIIWNDYVDYFQGKLTTADSSEDAIEFAKAKCAAERSKLSTFLCEDSIVALHNHTEMIDLLYLDSADVDQAAPHQAALHCFFEFTAAMPKLHSKSIVFIDDSPMQNGWYIGGKAKYVAEFFQKISIKPFTFGYQVAYLMP